MVSCCQHVQIKLAAGSSQHVPPAVQLSATNAAILSQHIDSTEPWSVWLWHHAAVKSSCQHQRQRYHHQHDSETWCVLPWLAIRLRGSPPIGLGGLRCTTLTNSPTRDKHIVSTMIWDTSPSQLCHFFVVFYLELISQFTFNWLIYYSSIITSRGPHESCYTAPIFNCISDLFNFYR
jgi:hypothetical protein